jgi:hypothetical protein
MAEMDSNCGNCKFYRAQQIMGVCRLYPTQQNKHEKDWCGQHLIVETQDVKVDLVALPVYDITTDQTTQVPQKRKYERKANAKASA